MQNHDFNEGNQVSDERSTQSDETQTEQTSIKQVPLESGDIRDGTITRIKEEAIFVDVGATYDAVIPQKEFKKLDQDTLDSFSPGDTITICIKHVPKGGGNPFAYIEDDGHERDGVPEDVEEADEQGDEERVEESVEEKNLEDDWERARTYLQSGEKLSLEITKQNRGGLIAKLGNLEGFIPNSHLPSLPHRGQHEKAQELKKQKIGETMELRVIEVDRGRNRLILSAKDDADNRAEKNDVLDNLDVGQTVSGKVVNLVDFGAFVDLGGGVNGLIHISELAWQHLEHPSDLLDVGDQVEVKIQKIERDRNRISLSRKALCSNPWVSIEERYQVGDLVEGVVTTVRKFGAFVRLAAGVEGLLHKSEMELAPGMEPKDDFQAGDEVLLRITSVDPSQERIGLSQQQVSLEERLSWTMHKKHEPPAQNDGPSPALGTDTPVS
jgi:small subunit ribosomal protein S1